MSMHLRLRAGRASSLFVATLLAATTAMSTSAHSPDPLLGGSLWKPNQAVSYQWRSGQVPPSWMAGAIDRGAADAGRSRASRAPTYARVTSGSASLIAYGEPLGCGLAAALACLDRSGAPSSFKMWFRAHGYVFDWGTLRWCEGLSVIANGCFDAETIALDEFGHVDDLGHHVNYSSGADYLDAVVQTVSRARPSTGWQVHSLARCDVARLQLAYDRLAPRDTFSSCLAIPTSTSFGGSATSLWIGESVRFTAVLRTTGAATNEALANDPISGRTVMLQRRTPGSTTWTSISAMVPSATTEGVYELTASPTATYEWSAVFVPASGDGALSSTSAVMKVTVSGCSGSGCPSLAAS